MYPAWVPKRTEACAVLLDRHVHKTGGTTLRNIFLNNECRDPVSLLRSEPYALTCP